MEQFEITSRLPDFIALTFAFWRWPEFHTGQLSSLTCQPMYHRRQISLVKYLTHLQFIHFHHFSAGPEAKQPERGQYVLKYPAGSLYSNCYYGCGEKAYLHNRVSI